MRLIGGMLARHASPARLVMAAILAVTLLLRIPSLFEPPWYDDEGIYAAVAHGLLNGRDLYREILDNRPPGIYFIYGLLLSWSNYAPWMIKGGATAAVLAGQIGLALVGRALWNAPVGLIAAAITGVVMSLPPFEGNIANAELFMLPAIAFGMLAIVRDRPLAAGVLFGVAFLVKQIAAMEAAAAALALLLWSPRQIGRAHV